MKPRPIIAKLLPAVMLTLAACGTPDEGGPTKRPPAPPGEPTIEERQQAYYDATHPSPHPASPDPASRPIPVEPDNGIA
jgi:hypothetical protein